MKKNYGFEEGHEVDVAGIQLVVDFDWNRGDKETRTQPRSDAEVTLCAVRQLGAPEDEDILEYLSDTFIGLIEERLIVQMYEDGEL